MNHHNEPNKIKWFSKTEHVDLETGEIITKSLYEREYRKIRITKKTEINESIGTIKYTVECRKHGQTTLF